MNQFEHQLYLRTPTGELLDIISDGYFAGLSYAFKDIEPGVLDLALPGDYEPSFLKVENQIEVYRSINGGSLQLEGDTAFFIRRISKDKDENGVEVINISAFSALEILRRRIVAYFAGTSYTEKIGIPWDDMMREFIDENYGPGASYAGASFGGDPDRNLEPYLVVENDTTYGVTYPDDFELSYGASYNKSAAWANILETMQAIVQEVRSNGIYATFDVVWVSPSHFEFRVFLGPRGVDHSSTSSSPVIVSEEHENLVNPSLTEDWSDEKNYVFGLGQGQGLDRALKVAKDDTRINISPFNRIEYVKDARNVEIDDSVQVEANAALEEKRPKITFSGSISQTEGCIYGVHWKWGDIVTAEYKGYSFDCYVDTVVVTIAGDGTEVVQGNLRRVIDVI